MKRLLVLCALLGCGSPSPGADSAADTSDSPDGEATAASDELGAGIPDARPTIPESSAYTPPLPDAVRLPPFAGARLLERPGLGLLSLRIVVPRGSAYDPPARSGLAALAAEMMEQGAGSMDGFELALAAERIGAEIAVVVRRDYSLVTLDATADRLEPALALLADVVLRPRFDAGEWARTKSLWLEDLDARAFEPGALAPLAADAALYGTDHPYGRPVDGLKAGVEAISLDEVQAFHRAHWRVDAATLVAVGEVTADGLAAAVSRAFAGVGERDAPPELQKSPLAPTKAWPRLVVVDRPDAPQTILRVTWPGPSMQGTDRSALEIVDFVLGGSFTSRLNSNLREDKGYTYGARSRLPTNRGAGPFTAGAAVQAEVTGKALTELLAELEGIAKSGPTPEEIAKARASLRNDDVQAYETVAGAADRLALLAGLGLPLRYDVDAATGRLRPSEETIAEAARFFFPDRALVVAVGDRRTIESGLKAEGIDLGTPEVRDAEGKRR